MNTRDTRTFRVEPQSDGSYRLHGDLVFETAPDALEQIEALLDRQPSVVLDLGGLGMVNSAALAVLIECFAGATRSGHELLIRAVPDTLMQLAGICELDSLLKSHLQPAP